MADTVKASDGTDLPVPSLPVAIAYNGDGTVHTMIVVYTSITLGANRNFTKTFTWSAGVCTNISNWVVS